MDELAVVVHAAHVLGDLPVALGKLFGAQARVSESRGGPDQWAALILKSCGGVKMYVESGRPSALKDAG